MTASRTRILFLCTGNSARSIMAEAIANQLFGDRIEASSAGSEPKTEAHPMTIATLARHGLSAETLKPESWQEYADREFDLVVTLCDSAARQRCPVFPGGPPKAHWGFPDPPEADVPDLAFSRVFEGIREAIERFVKAADDEPDVEKRARMIGEDVAGWFATA